MTHQITDLSDSRPYDAIIIGAGGAGMCLLLVLHQQGWLNGKRVLVLEPEAKVSNDRTWCFWARAGGERSNGLAPLASTTWDSAMGGLLEQWLPPYHYHHIRSADLYAHVHDLVGQHPDVHWMQRPADAAGELPNGAWVVSEGERFEARYVFDSRISQATAQRIKADRDAVWQSFLGWRIRLQEPANESLAVRLMDFDVEQDDGFQFVYVLPFNDQERLVEVTRFGRVPIEHARAKVLLHAWISSKWGHYERLEEEEGLIPMRMDLNPTATQHPAHQHLIPIGTAAGAVKATTGYALPRMYQHALDIARALQEGSPMPTPMSKPRFAFYDTLLLHILAHQPGHGKKIFSTLFQKVPLPRIFSFLDEQTTLKEDVRVLLSLPVGIFLRAFFSVYIWRNGMGLAPLVALMAVLLHILAPSWLHHAALPVLLAGLVFPGIPHGAMDHCLGKGGTLQGWGLIRFSAAYIGIMMLILALWRISPTAGVVTFVLYSAWHFGETDTRAWKAYHPARAMTYGTGLLLFVLFTHPAELSEYLKALGIGLSWPPYIPVVVSAAGLAAMAIPVVQVPKRMRSAWMLTFGVVAAGAFLPLLVAFGLYFVGIHSWRGWTHIRSGLRSNDRALLGMAAPFSLGAFGFFAVFMLLKERIGVTADGLMPAVFAFLAAVSAPHIWYMHRFYDHHVGE